jgi:hypothetical protein
VVVERFIGEPAWTGFGGCGPNIVERLKNCCVSQSLDSDDRSQPPELSPFFDGFLIRRARIYD